MRIAVDFDGTIVEHRYPEIGRERPFAIATLQRLQREGHQLILWTAREGQLLDDAIAFCRQRGLEFYAVNSAIPNDEMAPTTGPRKLIADLYIDDRNLGALPDWGAIYEIIHQGWSFEQYYAQLLTTPGASPRLSFWRRLLGR